MKVWFTGVKRDDQVSSEAFTYTVKSDTGNKILVLANEDYEGVNPTYPAGTNAPKYADQYVADLKEAGYGADVWDVSKQGVPHHLGVLSHYRGVVWYLGDNRLTQDPEDLVTSIFGQNYLNASVAERQQHLTLAVRDYLNEGGKLIHTGETTAYYGATANAFAGLPYGMQSDPSQKCVIVEDVGECLILSDDFTQYYLGADKRGVKPRPTGFKGKDRPINGVTATFGGQALADNPLNEAGVFTVISERLTPDKFPQFRSWASGDYIGADGAFDPVEGDYYVRGPHQDRAYMRLGRTVDLSAVDASASPTLKFQLSYSVEDRYDGVLVEARTVGQDDWTTLPVPGLTDSSLPLDCEQGFLLETHPFLSHYLTQGNPCTAGGTTGEWNWLTGNSGGWKTAEVDLSAYAGKQVEISITHFTDPFVGEIGMVVDDTSLVIGGTTTESEGFETGLGPWSFLPAPEGSASNTGALVRSQTPVVRAISTDDSLLLGFGIEQIGSSEERSALLSRAIAVLLGD